jgi:hypothetical protein
MAAFHWRLQLESRWLARGHNTNSNPGADVAPGFKNETVVTKFFRR